MNEQSSTKYTGRRASAWLAIAAAAAALCATSAQAASAVYGFDTTITSATPTGNPNQSDSVVGSITTDGTLGPLHGNDILAWNLQLIDHLNPSNNFTLTNSNSFLVEDGNGSLSATATGLFFDYGHAGEFLIQVSAYSGSKYFCFSTGGACAAGETISPAYVFTDGVQLIGINAPVGTQPLSPPTTPSAVPEPSVITMFVAGLMGLAFMRRRAALSSRT